MIPAILSCIFVIYLYQTLNRENSATRVTAEARLVSGQPDFPIDADSRLDDLIRRVDVAAEKLDQLCQSARCEDKQ